MMKYHDNRDLIAFSIQLSKSRNDLQNISFMKNSKSAECADEFVVLRRWSSYTPMAASAKGGGYFVRWKDKGIVIDPGCTFLDSFQKHHSSSGFAAHSLEDVNLIIATHDHPDHCEDLGQLLALAYAYKLHYSDAQNTPDYPIDLVVSRGVSQKYHTLIDNYNNQKFLRTSTVTPPAKVPWIKETELREAYHMDLECTVTKHREILGGDDGFGVKFTFHHDGGSFVLCDTGDTAYSESLNGQYDGSDVLLVHVGTLEEIHKKAVGRGEHLCFGGTVSLLRALKDKPKLVILGEWGEEFAFPGYRKRFTDFVKEYANLGDIPILPADLGMRIRIPDGHVWCNNTGEFERPEEIQVIDSNGQSLQYEKLL